MLIPALEPIMELFMEILKAILPVFIELVDRISRYVLPALSKAFEHIEPFIDGLKKALGGLMDFILGVFSGDWERAWSGIKVFFEGIWDSISGIFKGAINLIIKALNSLIKGINKLKFNVPKWVPLIGGKEWGLNIPEIPQLNVGTNYVPEDTLAYLHKGEAVVPKQYNPVAGGKGGGIVFDRGAFDGAIILDDYGVDRLMDRIEDRLRIKEGLAY